MDLDEALARLDQQNWDRIAHRVSAETGMDISPERATATDDGGRVVTGVIERFFALNNVTGRHDRARMLLDDGTTVAVPRTSLAEVVPGAPIGGGPE